MSPRAASRLGWSLSFASLALVALALLLVSLGWSTPLPGGWIPWHGQAIYALGIVGAPILGGFVASRRPENLYGWLWLGFSLSFTLLLFAQVYAAYGLVAQPGSLPAPRTVGTVASGAGWTAGTTLIPLLLMLFPTGRLPSHRWRPLAWAVVAAGATALLAGPFMPSEDNFVPVANPLGVGGAAGVALTALTYGAVLVVLIAIVPSALSLVSRYRGADGAERQQLKWFAFAAVLLAAEFSVQFFYEPPGAWDVLVEVLAYTVLYAAVGIAILRYRLYDIDRIINRTLVYGILTAVLASAYLGGVVSLQAALRGLTGQGSTLAVISSTLVIAALFSPLRRRVQGFVDRRFYRRKYDARKTLETFSATLRDETDLEMLGAHLVAAVAEAVQPAHASLWLRPANESKNGGEGWRPVEPR